MGLKICLDPGHGAGDPGAINGKRYEKDDVLRLALEIRPRLEAQGIEVLLTREKDLAVPIVQRCAMANAAGCAYFLSIHRDAAGKDASGVSVWVHSRADNDTVRKGRAILDAVLGVTASNNRGVCKGAANPQWVDYGVNTGTNMASCLLELGFITSDVDNERLDKHFEAYAEAIVHGLCAAVGKSYRTPTDQPALAATAVMGDAVATAAQMRAYLRARNPNAPDYTVMYLEEGVAEGVRGDVAFAQSCVETHDWRFGGDVIPSQNNFCGLGTTGGGVPGCVFATPREGIRAQAQHLKAYASTLELSGVCVDPRFQWVERGCAPYVEWLGQKENPAGKGWASGVGYGAAVLAVLADILAVRADPGRVVTWAEARAILQAAGVETVRVYPAERGTM